MRHYEIVFLVHPDQSEQVPAMIDRYKELVTTAKGLVHRTEDWGRRRLAYMINDVHKAHYAMLNVECGLDTLREIERNFKFNDSILRHLVIRRNEAITDESPMAKEKADEDRAEAERKSAESARAAANAEEEANSAANSDNDGENLDAEATADDQDETAEEEK